MLKVSLFGKLEVKQNGTPVELASRPVQLLLAYLVLNADTPHRRDRLAGLLWPDSDEINARNNLRQALWRLRQAIGDEYVLADRTSVGWNPNAEYQSDVAVLQKGGIEEHSADALIRSVSVYDDILLPGFYEDWVVLEQERWQAIFEDRIQMLLDRLIEEQRWRELLEWAERWIAHGHVPEPAYRALMMAHGALGDRAGVAGAFQRCTEVLIRELGVEPSAETHALFQALARGGGVQSTVVERVESSRAVNLPYRPTPFIGREEELSQLDTLLADPTIRLVTVLGPGGIGKTRLAIQAARTRSDAYADGVYFVPLDSLDDPDLVVSSIAGALGFSFYPREGESPKEQLLNYLCDKQMLLLLDNFEQLVDSAHLLPEILERARALKLLVTSRERLNLQPEWLFAVPGMRYPGEEPVESLEGYSAVQLFLRRASQVDPGFAVPQEEIPDLIRICQLVEGMPLGIELAAAWVKLLSCREIAAEIDRCLDFLTTAMRDVPDRHRSLWAACDHSWALLSEAEQRAFQRLSVFRGGFQRGAAERVAGASLPLLSVLVDKSLVRRTRSGRYEVHEVLRQYAADKLGQAPREEAETRDRHSAYFAAFLQYKERALKGPGQIKALEEIGADLQNVRAAWRWSIAQGKVAEIRRAAPGLWLFYRMRNLFEEGEGAFAQAVAMLEAKVGQGVEADVALGLALAFQGYLRLRRLWLEEEATPLLRKSLAILREAGAEEELGLALAFAFRMGVVENVAEAEKLLHESLAINRKLGRRWEAAFCLLSFSARAGDSWPGQVDPKPYAQESYALFSEIGDRWLAAHSLETQAWSLLRAGERQAAKQLHQESLAVFRQIGDGQAVQLVLNDLGYLTRELGEYEKARQLHREGLEIASEAGNRLGVADSLDNLGLVAYDVGDYEAAQRFFEEGLAIHREVGHQYTIAISLGHLGDVALAQRNGEEARRWYQECLEVGRGGEMPGRMAVALKGLGEVSSAEGDFEQARQHFRDALDLVMTRQDAYIPAILKVLVAVAQLTARMGEQEKPVEWLTYVVEHAASTTQTRDRAVHLLNELASQLPPQTMAAARERYSDRTLDEVVQVVLQEL